MPPCLSFRQTSSALLGSLITYAFANIYSFQVREQQAALPGLQQPVRVVQMSDLHYGAFIGGKTVRRWVDAALHLEPDVIVITGDFIDSHFGLRSAKELLAELARLSAPLGVYAVYGNHDWNSLLTQEKRTQFAQELQEVGIVLINNLGRQLRPDFYLCGVDDWWFGQQDTAQMLAAYQGGAVLLLSHNPDYLPHVPREVHLTLCGHTHGGQIQLPFVGPVKRASLYDTKFLEGWVETTPKGTGGEGHGGTDAARRIQGYVTHGLGVTGLPLRLDCPAELTVFHFLPPLP